MPPIFDVNEKTLEKLAQHSVLLIDDDKIYQFTARKILESTGLTKRILSFYNGEEAINYLKNEAMSDESTPDVIFLDINMPIMNGWEFLEEYKKLKGTFPKPIVVYMVSSSVDDSDIQRSKEYESVSDYIIKPIAREKYEQLITSLRDATQ